MDDFFARQIPLWGQENQNNLLNKSILIVGCGGLGCFIGYALSSCGIGKISFVDFDTIENSNIHRQIAFDFDDIGYFKAEVLAKKLQKRAFKKTQIEAFCEKFDEFIKKHKKFDLIIDASDNFEVRQQINLYAKKNSTPWIFSSVQAYEAQICFFENGDFNAINQTLSAQKIYQNAPMVMQAASFSANLALRYLVNLPIQKDTINYIFHDKNGIFFHKKFNICKDLKKSPILS